MDPSQIFDRAIAISKEGRTQEALDILTTLTQEVPDNGYVWGTRAIHLVTLGRCAEGISDYLKAIRLDPQTEIWREELAMLYIREGGISQAMGLVEEGTLGGAVITARVKEAEGKDKEALHIIENALAHLPLEGVYDGRAIPVEVHLAKLKEIYAVLSRRSSQPQKALDMLARPNLIPSTPPHLVHSVVTPNFNLLFERGHAFDLLGDYAAAWDCFVAANLLQGVPFDPRELDGRVGMPNRRKSNVGTRSGANLIFIVGIPRSGTSLLEQVLSQHSQVTAMGERGDFAQLAHDLRGRGQPDLGVGEIDQFAASYLEGWPETGFLTDKMPGNWYHLDLIRQVFPSAKIIHCVRDPQDCLVSCFKQRFSSNGLSWSSSPKGIQQYYGLWEKASIEEFEVQYESLVQTPEKVIGGVLDFLTLPFEEGCLTPEKSHRLISTASYAQVRQPIHPRSVGKGYNYAKWLPIKKTS